MSEDLPKGLDLSPTSSTGSAAAQESATYSAVRELATTLAPTDTLSAKLIKGKVISIQVGTGQQVTCTISLGGDETTSIPDVRKLDSYSPVVGDVVQVIMQGTEILILGRVDSPTTATAQNGWITAALGSGFTNDSSDPVQYRVITDNGDRKIQLRGRCAVPSNNTSIWTMPANMRPATYRSIVISRDVSGGSNTAVLGVNTNGVMFLDGTTTGIKSVNSRTGMDGGFSGVVGVISQATNGPRNPTGGFPENGLAGTGGAFFGDTSPAHKHGMGHDHTIVGHNHPITTGDHDHPITSTPVSFPDSLSFHGIEYFL